MAHQNNALEAGPSRNQQDIYAIDNTIFGQ